MVDLTDVALVAALMDRVPHFTSFPSVDEVLARLSALAEERPDVARWRKIGTSRLGEPLHVLTVGSGSRNAVVFAGVHPNEPVGGPTILHLADVLVADDQFRAQLDYTWHLVGCIDPDAMRLNEGWFEGPLTRDLLGRHFYRPAFDEQVAWTFPLQYKELYFDQVLPETLALMRLIDQTAPAFMCGLHNGEVGGAYYFLSEAAPDLYPMLQAIPAHVGLPLQQGEPELPFIPRYAAGIYGDISVEDQYAYAVDHGLDPATAFIDAGDSANSYARRHQTFVLTCELPYWSSDASSDTTDTDRPYADLLTETADALAELHHVLHDALTAVAALLQLNTPFLRAVQPFVGALAQQIHDTRRRSEQPDAQRPATVAETASNADLLHCLRIRYGGMLQRALQAEVDAGSARPIVRQQLQHLSTSYRAWAAAADRALPDSTVPIRDLAAVQYAAILSAADYARRKHDHLQTTSTTSAT